MTRSDTFFIQAVSEKEQIYRSKGFLNIAGNPRRAIFHGVNNRFTLLWDRLWDVAGRNRPPRGSADAQPATETSG